MARRFFQSRVEGVADWDGKVALIGKLDEPRHWRRPRRIFALGMTDWCHPNIPSEWLDDVFRVMEACPQHTFVMLTKRPERFHEALYGGKRRYLMRVDGPSRALYDVKRALPNVILGVSTENQKAVDERAPFLIEMRGMGWRTCLSCEPLLEAIDIRTWLSIGVQNPVKPLGVAMFSIRGVNWVIAGCESGPGARVAEVEWFRSLRNQCEDGGIPFFLKQMTHRAGGVQCPTGKPWIEKVPFLDGRQSINGPSE
jgi:protein gp37